MITNILLGSRRSAAMLIPRSECLRLDSSNEINDESIHLSDRSLYFRDLEVIEARVPSVEGKKRCCTSKTTLILLLIIVGLFCLISLAVGIYALVIAVNRNSNDGQTIIMVSATDTTAQSIGNDDLMIDERTDPSDF